METHSTVSRPLPRIAICGHGRSGKDESARFLAAHTPLRLGKTTSEVIAPHAAARLGLPVTEAFAQRHENRAFWYNVGESLREHDPAYLVRECLRDGEIVVGIRGVQELLCSKTERLIDLVVWIDRDVPADDTMKFGPELCDVIIQNKSTLEEFHQRLAALARWAGLLKGAA